MFKTFLSILTLISLFSTVAFAQTNSFKARDNFDLALGVGLSTSMSPSGVVDVNDDGVFTNPDLIRAVAENIFKVKMALGTKYQMADDVTLGMYILRYLADLGDNDLKHEDIQSLVSSLEDLAGEPFDARLKDILSKIKLVRFGQKGSKKYAKFYTETSDGIIVPLNRPMDGLVKEVEFIKVKNKARFYFEDIESSADRVWLKNFVKSKIKFLFWSIKALNLVHPALASYIKTWVEVAPPVNPMKIEIKDVFVRLQTKTIFKKMDFNFTKAVVMPGIANAEGPLPPLVIEGRDGLLRTKISIDE